MYLSHGVTQNLVITGFRHDAEMHWNLIQTYSLGSLSVALSVRKLRAFLIKGSEVNIYSLYHRDFPGGTVVKNPPANAGDTGSSPGPGRSHVPWSN